MSYGLQARKPTPLQHRAMNAWSERPGIVATALYTTEEAALVLALSCRVVEQARHAKGEKRLRYHRIGDSVRFLGEELLRWLKAHEVPEGMKNEIAHNPKHSD